MKKSLLLLLLLYSGTAIFSQNGFRFENGDEKTIVSFQLINNLVFVPIKVNGVLLNFLLDTGVSETILFSLEEKKEIEFSNTEKILFRGLGSQNAIEGLKSTNNILEMGSVTNRAHTLYIVLDPEFNFSSHIGIPVNGIIGYQFFKDNLVEIDYRRKRLVVYKNTVQNRAKVSKKSSVIPISVESRKPYVKSLVSINTINVPVKLLIDVGNSDAVWLFQDRSDAIKVPAVNFDDFLGRGFSGDVEGKRAQIEKFKIGKFEFKNVITAFPDTASIKNVSMVADRMGSVGGEIMKRFKVVFDYEDQKMYVKTNKYYNEPFGYNKSGIETEQNGLQWVQETVNMETVAAYGKNKEPDGVTVFSNKFKYKFELKPVYEIAYVRQNSPGAKAGLKKGDIFVKINNILPYRLSLQQINNFFKGIDDSWITIEVQRGTAFLKFKFQLDDVLR